MESCPWPKSNELYQNYHNQQWGEYTGDDDKHFEFLVLESAQAGLSWLTILKRREGYRNAYSNFNPNKVAEYKADKIKDMLNDSKIIRNRRKIEASINNAKQFLEIQKEFKSFNNYLLSFTLGERITDYIENVEYLPSSNVLSDRISKDMKKRGFKFLGSIIMYSHLQAVGIINDHIISCFRFKEIKAKGREICGVMYSKNIEIWNKGLYSNSYRNNQLLILKKCDRSIIGEVDLDKNKGYRIQISNINDRNEYLEEVTKQMEKYIEINKEINYENFNKKC